MSPGIIIFTQCNIFLQKDPKKFGDMKKMRTFASAFDKNA